MMLFDEAAHSFMKTWSFGYKACLICTGDFLPNGSDFKGLMVVIDGRTQYIGSLLRQSLGRQANSGRQDEVLIFGICQRR